MSKIKEVLCLHHSHLDIGYTHPQPLLMELQLDYIDEAIDLCLETENFPEESKFRWTCEATYPVLKWLETATSERVEQFKRLIEKGQISICAMFGHTTPLTDYMQMNRMLYPIQRLREELNIPIQTAINHDVNGQPWPMAQILLDANIEFYMTGINVHFGGIPFPRPTPFQWETPDGRSLLTFHGEHYSLFSQFFETAKSDIELMDRGIRKYVNRLEETGYAHDFIFLTATNPPLFDNNCPDPNLPDLIRTYNEANYDFKIRFVTPEMFLERIQEIDKDLIPTYRGDWTDYWNFGSGSSARETRLVRKTKQNLRTTDFLEAFQGSPGKQYDKVKQEVILNALLYEEHTWGAAQSITDPDDPEVYSQRTHKSQMAYQAADLSAYVTGKQMEKLAGNPLQSEEPDGILLMNPTNVEQQVEVNIPASYKEEGRHLSALRVKQYLPYDKDRIETESYGTVTVEPFSWKRIPFTHLERLKTQRKGLEMIVSEGQIETPFYTMKFDPTSGRIKRLFDKKRNWSMLDEHSEWTLFEFVRETIDPLHNKEERATFFPRDIDLGNKSISVWNHDWKSKRTGAEKVISFEIEETTNTITYTLHLEAPGLKDLKQKFTFYSYDPKITFEALINKEDVRTPESIYFAFPLNLKADWRSHYDTAGMFVELDEEQMGTVSKDWITVDQTVSVYDQEKGITLACPDAPLVQIGDFNFGKESEQIERNENPLLLAWPMNNYWDTNFWINQPGQVRFKYELSPFCAFDPKEAYQAGVKAANPVEMNVQIECEKEETGQFLKVSSENVIPVYVKKAENDDDLIVVLRNLAKVEELCTFHIVGQTIEAAQIVNTLEEEVEELPTSPDAIEISLKGQEVILVKVRTKKLHE